jgi:hypothetical protein
MLARSPVQLGNEGTIIIVGGDLCVPPLRAHTQVRPYVLKADS